MTFEVPEGPPPVGEVRMRSRRRLLFAVVAGSVAVLLASSAVVLGPRLRSPQQQAAEAAPPPASAVTAVAERRRLVEPVVLRGAVVPGASVKVLAPTALIGPDSVVTSVSVRKGTRVREGTVLLDCAGMPLVALQLPFPLYRDIIGGSTGPDVKELQYALRRLGYSAPTSGKMDAATQRAFAKWWKSLGYTAPRQDAGSGKSTGDTPADSVSTDGAGAGEAAAGAPAESLESGVYLPRATILRLADRGSVTAVHVRRGDVLTNPEKALIELNGATATVLATATKEQVGLLSVGQSATALDEIAGTKIKIVIAAVGETVVDDATTGATGFPVRFRFQGESVDAAGRTLRIDIASGAEGSEVLAVPVTALYSRADGSTYVVVLDDERNPVETTVEVGATGGGWAAIQPAPANAVTEGTPVLVGKQ